MLKSETARYIGVSAQRRKYTTSGGKCLLTRFFIARRLYLNGEQHAAVKKHYTLERERERERSALLRFHEKLRGWRVPRTFFKRAGIVRPSGRERTDIMNGRKKEKHNNEGENIIAE